MTAVRRAEDSSDRWCAGRGQAPIVVRRGCAARVGAELEAFELGVRVGGGVHLRGVELTRVPLTPPRAQPQPALPPVCDVARVGQHGHLLRVERMFRAREYRRTTGPDERLLLGAPTGSDDPHR